MKTFILSLLFLSSIAAYGYSQTDKVPGTNYTYGEYMFNRAVINKFRAEDKKDTLKGEGMEFYGNITIKKESKTNELGAKEETMKYTVYVRNCGNIEVPKKDEKEMKEIKSGMRIKMFLKGSSCEISDWEKF